ncbi:hypothetical protein GUJ93_ZPchr0011g28326 [Zizania palustris]|uniref:Uncharacterized protein n=1 Tax=Zizania palustris TaxID=103762 RepID=A0A8J5WL21_ZIZPA|nr:hypothetical protein GUJ93_ZPchr0011g28326 [Zizania palustris]
MTLRTIVEEVRKAKRDARRALDASKRSTKSSALEYQTIVLPTEVIFPYPHGPARVHIPIPNSPEPRRHFSSSPPPPPRCPVATASAPPLCASPTAATSDLLLLPLRPRSLLSSLSVAAEVEAESQRWRTGCFEADGWERARSDFPIICESCLGDNPYVRMPAKDGRDLLRIFKELKQSLGSDWAGVKPPVVEEDMEFLEKKQKLQDWEQQLTSAFQQLREEYDKEGKICAHPFTVFHWRPGRDARSASS